MNFFKSNNQDNISQYDSSSEDLSYRQMRFSEWYLRNKATIKKWFTRSLMAFCVITVGGSFIGWVYYFSFGYWNDKDVVAQEVALAQDYQRVQGLYQAQRPDISPITVLQNGTNKYDVFARVQNPNEYWLLNLKYKFVYSGGETSTSTATVLPLQDRPISALGIQDQRLVNGAELRVLDLGWKRVGPSRTNRELNNISNYKRARLVFSVSDFNFTSADVEEGLPAKVSFKIKNNSAYSYWEPELFLRLYDQGNLVRVRKVKINKFLSGAERAVELSFADPNINITRVEYTTILDIFDREEFMEPPS